MSITINPPPMQQGQTVTYAPASAEPSPFGPDGKITREGAIAAIQNGGSVLWHVGHDAKGNAVTKYIRTLAELPSESEFAKGDPNREAVVRENLKRTIADSQAQLAALNEKRD